GALFRPGAHPRVAEIMAAADIGVVPKRANSFGNEAYSTKIMEFMAVGVPVIVSSTRVDRFYFDDSVVRFFESGNVEALTEAMDELLSDPARRAAVRGHRRQDWPQRPRPGLLAPHRRTRRRGSLHLCTPAGREHLRGAGLLSLRPGGRGHRGLDRARVAGAGDQELPHAGVRPTGRMHVGPAQTASRKRINSTSMMRWARKGSSTFFRRMAHWVRMMENTTMPSASIHGFCNGRRLPRTVRAASPRRAVAAAPGAATRSDAEIPSQ
ncbi:MAG: glycosyltransferase family 4 protein, partial [Candidatus Competibacteraceae bacterium]|nr:glycosyltransferase family 4 protein [Candidatus Competibacteraceae bacterium]